MQRSRTITILKRDGTAERFDRRKLRACLLRVMAGGIADLHIADALASAVAHYIAHRRIRALSSAALLEMALTVLHGVGLVAACEDLEAHHAARLRLRRLWVVHHGDQMRTAWSKDWLIRQGCSQWGLGRPAARIVAGQVERALLAGPPRQLTRSDAMEMLSGHLAAYGLSRTAVKSV